MRERTFESDHSLALSFAIVDAVGVVAQVLLGIVGQPLVAGGLVCHPGGTLQHQLHRDQPRQQRVDDMLTLKKVVWQPSPTG